MKRITARSSQARDNALDWDNTQSASQCHPSVSAGKIGKAEDRYLRGPCKSVSGARKVGKAEDRHLNGPCKSVSYRGIAIHSLRQTKVNRNEIGKWQNKLGYTKFFRKMPIL